MNLMCPLENHRPNLLDSEKFLILGRSYFIFWRKFVYGLWGGSGYSAGKTEVREGRIAKDPDDSVFWKNEARPRDAVCWVFMRHDRAYRKWYDISKSKSALGRTAADLAAVFRLLAEMAILRAFLYRLCVFLSSDELTWKRFAAVLWPVVYGPFSVVTLLAGVLRHFFVWILNQHKTIEVREAGSRVNKQDRP